MTKVIVDNDPVQVYVADDIYNVSVSDDRITVAVRDAIIVNGSASTVVEEELYDIEIDTSVPGVTYVGQALPGTAKTTAAWRIKKITDSAGGSSVDWANGVATFSFSWDDRLSLTYGP